MILKARTNLDVNKLMKKKSKLNFICFFFQDRKNALSPHELLQKMKVGAIINKSRQYVAVGTEIPPGGVRKGIFLAYQNLKFLSS